MSEETPTKGTAKGWSDAEKVALLWSIIEGQGPVDWKKVKIPEGRTQKACTHVIASMRKTAKEFNEGVAPATPTVTKPAANKRKRATKANDDADEDDDEAEMKQARPKRGKKANLVVKTDLVEKEEPEEDE